MDIGIRVAILASLCGFSYASATVHVSLSGDDTTGDSWASALQSVEDALEQVAAGESVYVAEGTYIIGSESSVPEGVKILGGFPDPSKGLVVDRDPTRFVTTLDGDGVAGSIFVVDGVDDVEIDGFTLTGCVGAGDGYAKGGAIRVNGSGEVEIRACDFSRNEIEGYGGGVNVLGASAKIQNCVFRNNFAEEGGGVKVHEGLLKVTGSVFRGNTANLIGGAASGYESSVQFNECVFIGNDGPYGGGVECHEGTGADFENCLFANNSATTQGGALSFTFQDDVEISNCTIVRNKTNGNGAGVFMHDSTGEIVNTIFSRNRGHAVFENDSTADPEVKNCLFDFNSEGAYLNEGSQTIASATGNGGMNSVLDEASSNLDGNPLFADADKDDYHIRLGSPAIDTGTRDSATDIDIDGFARPADVSNAGANGTGNEFDIGFDEYDPDAMLTVVAPNGGEEFVKGEEVEIAWASDGYTGVKVKIELWRRNERALSIATTVNDGAHRWRIPVDLRARWNYKLVIISTSFPEFFDQSDGKFAITN